MRSGSTLLKALMAAAPDISSLPETNFQKFQSADAKAKISYFSQFSQLEDAVSINEILDGLFGEIHRMHDDLAAIKGVGPKVVKRLEDAGIRTYAQLAALGTKDLGALAAALEVPARRIEREGWIESARALSKG